MPSEPRWEGSLGQQVVRNIISSVFPKTEDTKVLGDFVDESEHPTFEVGGGRSFDPQGLGNLISQVVQPGGIGVVGKGLAAGLSKAAIFGPIEIADRLTDPATGTVSKYLKFALIKPGWSSPYPRNAVIDKATGSRVVHMDPDIAPVSAGASDIYGPKGFRNILNKIAEAFPDAKYLYAPGTHTRQQRTKIRLGLPEGTEFPYTTAERLAGGRRIVGFDLTAARAGKSAKHVIIKNPARVANPSSRDLDFQDQLMHDATVRGYLGETRPGGPPSPMPGQGARLVTEARETMRPNTAITPEEARRRLREGTAGLHAQLEAGTLPANPAAVRGTVGEPVSAGAVVGSAQPTTEEIAESRRRIAQINDPGRTSTGWSLENTSQMSHTGGASLPPSPTAEQRRVWNEEQRALRLARRRLANRPEGTD